MYIYFLILISVLFLGFFSDFFKNNSVFRYILLILIVLILSIMPGLKDVTVGTDTITYIDMMGWENSYSEWMAKGLEIGYVFYIKVLKFLNIENYTANFLILALIFNYLIVSSIFKLKYSVFICILSFMTFSFTYLSHFNILRQSLAVAFFIASIPYLFNNDNLKTYLFLILAITFHYSAILLLLIPFLYRGMQKNFFKVTLFSVLFFLFYSIFSNKFINYIILFTGSDRYDYYLDSQSAFDMRYQFAVYSMIWLMAFLFYFNSGLKKNNYYLFFFFLLTMHLTLLFCITFLGLNYEGPGRLLVYFSISHVFIFPFIIKLFTGDARIIVLMLFVIFMFLYFWVIVSYFNVHGVFPYAFSNLII